MDNSFSEQALKDKELILNNLSAHVIHLDEEMRIIYANKSASEFIGRDQEELEGEYCHMAFNQSREACKGCPAVLARDERKQQKGEITTPDGRIWSVEANPVFTETGDFKGVVEIRKDATEQKITEETLRETKELFRFLAENAQDLIFRYRFLPTRGFDYVSPSSINIAGYGPGEFYAQRDLFFNIVHPEDRQRVKDHFEKTDTQTPTIDFRLMKKEGTTIWLELQLTPQYDVQGKVISIQGIGRDITEWKQDKNRQKLVVQILEGLNQIRQKTDRIMLILLLIKEYTDFEAVGIRLKEGQDFPYYETNGFPVKFVQAEKYLCAHNETGDIIKDSNGNPVLECMCGDVISGRTNPSLPFFTRHGSFWTNSTTELLATTTEEDRQARTRNLCNAEGYETVVLIPLRSDHEIIGLLQLNDKRKGMITREMVEFFEGIGASIGIDFKRNQVEEERENLITQLKDSISKVKVLSGLLPICASCKKIRDDRGYWNQIEEYISKYSEAEFSHSYCPDCAVKLKSESKGRR